MERWSTKMHDALRAAAEGRPSSPLHKRVLRRANRGMGTFRKKKYFYVRRVPREIKRQDNRLRKRFRIKHLFPARDDCRRVAYAQ